MVEVELKEVCGSILGQHISGNKQAILKGRRYVELERACLISCAEAMKIPTPVSRPLSTYTIEIIAADHSALA
jgi:hypothetical protein